MDNPQREAEVREYLFEDDGRIPNNPNLPLLIYPGYSPSPSENLPAVRSYSRGTAGAGLGETGSSPTTTITPPPTRY